MKNKINRKRSVDVEKLSVEQVDRIKDQVVIKLRALIDDACEKANEIVNIYGLEAKMEFSLKQKSNRE